MKAIQTYLLVILINVSGIHFVFSQDTGKDFSLFSPDSSIEISIFLRNETFYQVKKDGEIIIKTSPVSLSLENGEVFGRNPALQSHTVKSLNKTIQRVWGLTSELENRYNELVLNFKGGYSLLFRGYNEGMAYRWKTGLKKEIIIKEEEAVFCFKDHPRCWAPNENTYETSWTKNGFWELDIEKNYPAPIVVQATKSVKVAITESDVLDYPSMFLKKTSPQKSSFSGTFQPYPMETKWGGFNNYTKMVTKPADYIAKTTGTRSFPWRVVIVADNDKVLAYNELVFKLASPQVLQNTDWIDPGKVAWEWWNNYILKGVDFKTGVNTRTYLYHIDFAAEYGLEYILIDWQWTDDRDLSMLNPEVDIKKICQYASKKNVKVIVWTPGFALHDHLDKTLDLFQSYGVSGIKADFFDRDDQLANQMYERIARAAAKRQFVVDFHGCAKPTGLSKMYPNILNYEAVRGNESNKWNNVSPEHQINIAFIRMLNGTMDFTPGGMKNSGEKKVKSSDIPYVMGTRCHQAAMFVVYFEALKMMADSPTSYEAEPEFTRFITEIPTTWDETKVLDAKFGEYIMIARKTGDIWYLGVMLAGDEKDIIIDCSFLANDQYNAKMLVDGKNADRLPADYRFINKNGIKSSSKLKVHLHSSGGAVIRFSK
jgi:alpha-glucosidase